MLSKSYIKTKKIQRIVFRQQSYHPQCIIWNLNLSCFFDLQHKRYQEQDEKIEEVKSSEAASEGNMFQKVFLLFIFFSCIIPKSQKACNGIL